MYCSPECAGEAQADQWVPKRGFIQWEPRGNSKVLIDQVSGILEEYVASLPITVRQIFYRMVGKHDYPKDQAAYQKLVVLLGSARRGRVISFSSIRDDGITIDKPYEYDDPDDLIFDLQNSISGYRVKRLSFQEHDIRIWCEAAGMVPQIAQLVEPYGIPVQSSGGQDSIIARYERALGSVQQNRHYPYSPYRRS